MTRTVVRARLAGAFIAMTVGAAVPMAAVSWVTPWPQAAAPARVPAAEALTVTHAERALEPGEAVLLTVSAPVPLVAASAAAAGTTVPGFSGATPSTWQVLIGIDLDTKPGAYRVAINARTVTGSALTADVSVQIAAKTFPTRRLQVAPQFVSPPRSALARIERDRQLLARVLAGYSPSRWWGSGFQRPVPGALISGFGTRSVFNGQSRAPHRGADFAGESGTPVVAPAAGRVVAADDLYFSGNTVVLDHGLGVFSLLCHFSRIDVRVGDTVSAGQRVGAVGATGRVTGPHLHWTARIGPASVDPISLLAIRIPEYR